MKKRNLIFSLSVLFLLSFSFIVFGWFEPITSVVSGYKTPLNSGGTTQTKQGALSAGMFYDYNDPSYYINPSGNSNIAGKITTNTSTLASDSAGTIATKDYVDSNCILVAYNGTCPTGFSTSTGTSRGAGYIMCCRTGS
ncbi:MAG: hypothetical protein PHH71_02135 [Clostridia bacterium]|nr:hypothetical protein [Clostridia bacterium]